MSVTILSTERLVLRSAHPEDFEALLEGVFIDPDVMKYLSGLPLERQSAAAFFDVAFDHDGLGKKIGVLVERATKLVIGYAGLKEFTALGKQDLELGFVLSRQNWGKGYATEIGFGQLAYGFSKTDVPRLVAQVRPENRASASVLKRIGMTLHSEYERPHMGTWHIYVRARET